MFCDSSSARSHARSLDIIRELDRYNIFFPLPSYSLSPVILTIYSNFPFALFSWYPSPILKSFPVILLGSCVSRYHFPAADFRYRTVGQRRLAQSRVVRWLLHSPAVRLDSPGIFLGGAATPPQGDFRRRQTRSSTPLERVWSEP